MRRALLVAVCAAFVSASLAPAAYAAPPKKGSAGKGAPDGGDDGGDGGGDGEGYGDDDAEGFGGGDDEKGFGGGDDTGFADMPAAATPAKVAPPSPLSLTGFVRSDQGLWVERFTSGKQPEGHVPLPGGDDNPFAKARQNLDLTLSYKRGRVRVQASVHGEFDAAYLYRADEYDQATKDTYRQLLQVRESFVALSLGAFELTLGRQVVAWGEGDGMSVIDVVNPRDLREPGLSDLEDIRVPVLASRIGWFKTTASGDHRVELMVVHETCNNLWRETCFGLRTPPLGPFSPLPAFFANPDAPVNVGALLADRQLSFDHDRTELSAHNQQLYLRWVYKGAGVDLGAYAASVLDQQGVIGDLPVAQLAGGGDTVALPLRHLRYQLVGTSGATTAGEFLLKWELAWGHDKPFNIADPAAAIPELKIHRSGTIEAMGSLTWRGLSNTMIGVEASKRWLLDAPSGPEALLFPAEAPSISVRVQHDTWRETLHVSAVGMAFGATAQYGWLARGGVTWDIRDALSLSLSYVTFQPGEEFGPFAGLERHDRLGLQLRWDFVAL